MEIRVCGGVCKEAEVDGVGLVEGEWAVCDRIKKDRVGRKIDGQ